MKPNLDACAQKAGPRAGRRSTMLKATLLVVGVGLAADHARHVDPHAESNGEKDLLEALAEGEGDGEHEQQGGNAPHDLEQPTDGVVKATAEVSSESTQWHANHQREQHGQSQSCP